jgi:transposase
MEKLWLTEGVELFDEIDPLLNVAEALRDHVKCSDAWLLKAAKAHPLCKRFLEIPGVGPICALSFYSAVEEPFRFERSSDVAAYLGLTPRVHQSGNTRRALRITRMGNALTRTHLVQAANCLLRAEKQPTRLREWGVELARRIGGGKARVAVARKLAVVMIAMWKNDARFDPWGKAP